MGRIAGLLVPAIPYLWLALLFLVPCLIVLKISLSDTAVAQPPYRPVFEWTAWRDFVSGLDLENFALLADDELYWAATLSSLRIALVSTLLVVAAFAITRVARRKAARGAV